MSVGIVVVVIIYFCDKISTVFMQLQSVT